MIKRILFCSFSVLALLLDHSHVRAATFDVVFPIDRDGQKSVLVSDDGSTVMSASPGGGNNDLYLWKKSQGIVETYPRGTVQNTGMSGDGQTIFSNYYPDPVFWMDASHDGSVRAGGSGNLSVALINGHYQSLGKLPSENYSNYSGAWAVSADGTTIIGDSTGPYGRVPYRWTAATGMVPLDTLPDGTITTGTARGVSADGRTIVGRYKSQDSDGTAFRWTAENGLQSLGRTPNGGPLSTAYATSADGNIVVGQAGTPVGHQAFIWNPTQGMRELGIVLTDEYHLDLHGLSLLSATDISASGQVIVGWGVDAQYNGFAFRVDLVPEPASLAIAIGLGLLLLAPIRVRWS